jgi:3-(3-hydroxy-phenyl)propionate hydroxylase
MEPSLNNSSYDVVIVGYGPSGAVAAALMGKAGVRTLLVDRLHEVYDKPRAISLDHEIMRVFQQIGIVDEILPWTESFTPSEYYGVDHQLIKRLATVEPPYPLGYSPSLVFSQPSVEKVLRQHVGSLASVTVALGQEFVGLEQDERQVHLTLSDLSGKASSVTARYVIACDGASSSVRSAVGIGLDDLEFDEPWLVVDVLVNESGLAKLPRTSVQYCEPERPCTYVIGPKNHRRWEISLLPGEEPKDMTTEAGAWSVLKRWITPEDGTLWRQASYRFHALVSHDWRSGRVFIAGDAAHQQPPFLGQGMCQGIRDVTNLSWKLQAALAGHGGDELLDSYGAERGRHVRSLTGRIKAIGKVICERDPALARIRDANLLKEAGGTIKTMARQDIIPPLETGLLYPDSHPARGTLFPQPKVDHQGSQALLDDVAGCGWRIVTNRPLEDIPASARKLAAGFGALISIDTVERPNHPADQSSFQLREAEGVLAKWFDKYQCVAAVVRPDHYVYGAAKTWEELAAMIGSLIFAPDQQAPSVKPQPATKTKAHLRQ